MTKYKPTDPAARTQQRFLILLSRDNFQEDIKRLRGKWAIPQQGLKTPEEHEAWWHRHTEDSDNYYTPANQKRDARHMLKAERQWRAKKITTQQLEEEKKAINDRNPVNNFWHDLEQVIKRYRLPPRWKDAIRAYLFTNEPRYRGTVGITIESTFGREEDRDEIHLVLDAHVTRQELIDAWPSIKFHLGQLRHKDRSKFQPVDVGKLARNKLAYQLREQGKENKEIAAILSEKYNDYYEDFDVAYMIKNYLLLLKSTQLSKQKRKD